MPEFIGPTGLVREEPRLCNKNTELLQNTLQNPNTGGRLTQQ